MIRRLGGVLFLLLIASALLQSQFQVAKRRTVSSAAATPTDVSSFEDEAFGSSTTGDFSLTDGSYLLCGLCWFDQAQTISSFTVGCGGTPTLAHNPTDSTPASIRGALAHTAITSTDASCTITLTLSGGSDWVRFVCREVSGQAASSPVEATVVNAQSDPGLGDNDVTSGDVTTSGANRYIGGFACSNSSGSAPWTAGSGYSDLDSTFEEAVSEWKEQASAGDTPATFKHSAEFGDTIAFAVAVKP